jgi:uncharacterized protein GlcG (DUF336 family)
LSKAPALPHIVTLQGSLVVGTGGRMLGAIGVADAPGRDKSEECAKPDLDAIRDRLDF